MTQPYYPNLDGKVDYDVAQGIRTAYDFLHMLTARVNALESSGFVTRHQAFEHLGPSSLRKQLQVTGSTPLNVTGLAGQLAQPQIADAPSVTALPPITDPLSQDGTLVSLSGAIYRFNGTTDPGTWQPITAAPSGSLVNSLDGLTGALSLVAGTNITISDNTPAPGDIQISAPGASTASISAFFPPYYENGGSVVASANAIRINMFNLPASITTTQVTWRSFTADAVGNYSIGIYNFSGTLVLNTATFNIPTSGNVVQSLWSQGSTTLSAGSYFFAFTGTSTTGALYSQGSGTPTWLDLLSSQTPVQTSTAGVLPGSITVPALTGNGTSSNKFCWVIS